MNRRLASALLAMAAVSAVAEPIHAQAPAEHVEIGALDSVPFRIDMPSQWNGILLIYYHGYAVTPVVFASDKPNPIGEGFAAQGFAVAQSAYSDTGWVVEQALSQTEALRRYTIAHYGKPKETYVMGTRWAAC